MAKTWVLDTETKGTGAQMIPLEKVLRRPGPEPGLDVVSLPRPDRPQAPPEVRQPRRFKVVDVVSREVLAEDADARATVALLEGVRSMVDVTVSVWEPKREAWRSLTLAEQRALWDFRGRCAEARAAWIRAAASAPPGRAARRASPASPPARRRPPPRVAPA